MPAVHTEPVHTAEHDLRNQVLALREALERARADGEAATAQAAKLAAGELAQLKALAVELRAAMERAAAKNDERVQQIERAFHDERAQLQATVRDLRQRLEAPRGN